MNRILKKVLIAIAVLCFAVGVFVAGYYLGPFVLRLGFFSKTKTTTIAPSEPYTAEEVVDVKTIEDFDSNGAGEVEISQQMVPYVVSVDFAPVLLKEAQLEKKLIIMSQNVTASEIATKTGLFSWTVFNQSQAIIFHGEGTYYVDLSYMTDDDFIVDNEKKVITIKIPKPELSVRLLPDETEFLTTSNGSLRFGPMEITPEIMTTIEIQGLKSIEAKLLSDRNTMETAYKFAKLSVKEIYEPLIKAQVDAAVRDAADEYAVGANYTIIVEIKD